MLLTAAVSCGLLSGCSTSSKTDLALPARNIEQWTLPLDQYEDQAPNTGTYAELLLVKPCLESAGYKWNVPYVDPRRTPETSNSIGRRLFTEEIAAKWGYHYGGNSGRDTPEWKAFRAQTKELGDAELKALRLCQSRARKVIPQDDEAHNYAAGLVDEALRASYQDAGVRKAAERWHDCMLPLGIADLGSAPNTQPSHMQTLLYDLAGDGAATTAERQAATADFRCRVSSGYRAAAYAAEWSKQVELLRANLDTLERNKVIIDKNARAVADVINEHAVSS